MPGFPESAWHLQKIFPTLNTMYSFRYINFWNIYIPIRHMYVNYIFLQCLQYIYSDSFTSDNLSDAWQGGPRVCKGPVKRKPWIGYWVPPSFHSKLGPWFPQGLAWEIKACYGWMVESHWKIAKYRRRVLSVGLATFYKIYLLNASVWSQQKSSIFSSSWRFHAQSCLDQNTE